MDYENISQDRGVLSSAIARTIAFLFRFGCQHNYMRRSASGWLWLECTECGHRTPGFDWPYAAPRARLVPVVSTSRSERTWSMTPRRVSAVTE